MGSKINKNIKPLILIALVFFIPLRNITAQTSEPRNNMSIGFQINQYQDDFGIGINATSPFFIYQKVAVRLRSNLMFNEHLKNQEATWTPYLNATVGLLGKQGGLVIPSTSTAKGELSVCYLQRHSHLNRSNLVDTDYLDLSSTWHPVTIFSSKSVAWVPEPGQIR